MLLTRFFAPIATAAFLAAGARVPAAEETQEMPLEGKGLKAQIRTLGNFQNNPMRLAAVMLFVTAGRHCPATVDCREYIEAPRRL